MALNSIALAEIMTQTLDEQLVIGAKSSFMEQNQSKLTFTGYNTCKVPKMTTGGLGTYNRETGYTKTGFSVSYETFTMGQDRGVQLLVDAETVDESNMVATVGNAMSTMLKTQVAPEIDKYRFSKVASLAMATGLPANASYGYTPIVDDILSKVQTDITNMQDVVGNDLPLVLIMSTKTAGILERSKELARQLELGQLQGNNIDYVVPCKVIDSIPVVEVPSARLKTKYIFQDGVTAGQEAGGVIDDVTAKNINWILMAVSAPIAVAKTARVKIFDPSVVQDSDDWKISYRVYHDLFIEDNQMPSVFVNIKEASV